MCDFHMCVCEWVYDFAFILTFSHAEGIKMLTKGIRIEPSRLLQEGGQPGFCLLCLECRPPEL